MNGMNLCKKSEMNYICISGEMANTLQGVKISLQCPRPGVLALFVLVYELCFMERLCMPEPLLMNGRAHGVL